MSSSKPRVLRVINRFNLGGPTYNAAYLSKYLEDDFDTLLIGGQKQESEASSTYITEQLGLDVTVIPEMTRSIGFSSELKAYREISRIIKTFKPDIVHTHASKAGALGRLAAKKNKVPHIVHTFHGHVFEHYFNKTKTQILIYLERFLASFTDRVIAISEKQKYDLTERFKISRPEKVDIIPLGFDLSRFSNEILSKRQDFRKKYEVGDTEIAIGIIGRLVPIKDHHFFIDVLSILKREGIKFRSFVVGDGELKTELIKYAEEKGLSTGKGNDIEFTSWIIEVDIAIAGIDIIAMTSKNEGTPVSLIEAQAGRKPVISTNVGGVENAVIRDQSAILVNQGDLHAFSNGLRRLIEDEALRNSYGRKGYEFVSDKYHVDRLVSDVKKLYLELLNQ